MSEAIPLFPNKQPEPEKPERGASGAPLVDPTKLTVVHDLLVSGALDRGALQSMKDEIRSYTYTELTELINQRSVEQIRENPLMSAAALELMRESAEVVE